MSRQPNIIVMVADDLGFSDLGCFGGEIDTPHLDKLAESGIRFSQFYTNAKCSPSRASLLTGLYAEQVTENSDLYTLHKKNNLTLAELLQHAGYRTMAAGKWHNGTETEQRPLSRGFERYWGILSGCSNYFNPGKRRKNEPEPGRKWNDEIRPWCDQDEIILPFTPSDPNFYTTDAITDHALKFLEESTSINKPFFLYLSHCAPHFPLHAWPDDIKKYRGRYSEEWLEIRNRRYARLIEMGLIDEEWGLPEPDHRSEISYEALGDYANEAMCVYAAMVDRLDQGIGKILDKVKELGEEDNTLTLFFSDNGGCAEEIHNTPETPPGSLESYHSVGAAWANVSNTPFRLFKDFDHEGGIATPLIANWPNVIQEGKVNHSVGHIIDLMPTFAELAGINIPTHYKGRRLLPLEGRSLAPIFFDQSEGTEERELYWMIGGSKAMRKGKWKIVTQGPQRTQAGLEIPCGQECWELYNMEADRCELKNLACQDKERVKSMSTSWNEWYQRCLSDSAG